MATGSTTWSNLQEPGAYLGTQTSNLGVSLSYSMNGDQLRCLVNNRAGSVTSNAITLTVTPTAPRFLGFLNGQSVVAGTTVEFNAGASGTAPLSYQWQKDGVAIPNATSSKLTLTNVQAVNQGSYTVVATNNYGSATSSAASLQIISLPVISQQPASITRAIGESASFSVTTGTSPAFPSYQWLRNGAIIAGATSASLSLSNIQASAAGLYSVRITNPAGTTISSAAELNVVPTPAPTIQANSGTTFPVNWGGSITLSLTVSGATPISYQWYRDGQPLAGATQASLTLTNAGVADFAEYYFTASNAAGTTLSPTLRVVPLPDSTFPAPNWVDAQEIDGVLYFAFADTPRILRYELATESWLPPWNLPAAPVAMAFSADALYIAAANSVTRYGRDFTSPSSVFTSATAIRTIGVFGDVLIVAAQGNISYATIVSSCNRQSGQAIAQQTFNYVFRGDFCFDQVAGLLFGRDSSSSPVYDAGLPINANGTFGTVVTNYSQTTPNNQTSRTWPLKPGSLIAQASGYVLDSKTLAVVNSLGFGIDHAIEHPDGFYALQGGRLREFDRLFRETRSTNLGFRGSRIARTGSSLYVFAQPLAAGGSPSVTKVAPATLSAPVPAPARDATALAIPSPQFAVDDDGTVYAWSRLHQNIYRWSSESGVYGDALGLATRSNFFAVDLQRRRATLESDDHQVMAQQLETGAPAATPFYRSPGVLWAVTSTGNTTALGMRPNEYTYSPLSQSQLIFVDTTGSEPTEVFKTTTGLQLGNAWSEANQAYYYLPDRSPPNLSWLKPGPQPSSNAAPYSDSNWAPPIRPSPDGAWVSLGNGRILRGIDLTDGGYIARAHADAVWSEDRVHTIRPSLAGTIVESWSVPQLQLLKSSTIPGNPLRIFRLKSDRLLVITEQGNVPAYRVLAAPTLAPIAATDRVTPPEILRQSADVAGAAGGSAAFWVETAGGVLPTYRWQMRAAGTSSWVDVVDDGNVSGSRSARLSIATLQVSHAGARFRVNISNPGGSVTSGASGISVAGPAAVTQVASNSSGIFFVRADGSAWLAQGSVSEQLASDVAHIVANHTGACLFKPNGFTYGYLGDSYPVFIEPGQDALDKLPRRLTPSANGVSWGWAHMLLLDKQGTLWGSGAASQGQLGAESLDPVSNRLIARSVVAVAAGGGQSTWFITADGTLKQLGNFGGEKIYSPRTIDTNVVQVVVNSHVVYLKGNGSVWALGNNSAGQLGDGSTTTRTIPAQVATGVKAIAVGSAHTLLLKVDGSVWAAGQNGGYQFGTGSQASSSVFVQIASAATQIAASDSRSALLRADGSLWVAGNLGSNSYKVWTRLASGLPSPATTAIANVSAVSTYGAAVINWSPVLGSTGYEILRGTSTDPAAATSLARDLALPYYTDSTGTSGTDYYYFVRSNTPAGTTPLSAPISGRKGAGFAPVIIQQPADKSAYSFVQLSVQAEADPLPSYRWQELPVGATVWQDIVSGASYSGPNTDTLRLFSFNSTRSGTRLRCIVSNAVGITTSREATVTATAQPTTVSLQPSTSITAKQGEVVSIVGYASGQNLRFQWNRNGQAIAGKDTSAITFVALPETQGPYTLTVTGDGGTVVSLPVEVVTVPAPAVTGLAAGLNFSVLLMADGSVRGMGRNDQRQLGFGLTSGRIDPPVSTKTTYPVFATSTGPRHSLYVDTNGGISAGGSNTYGQLLGSTTVGFPQVFGSAAVAAGGNHSVFIKTDASAWAAGLNDSGQLGDGTTTNRTTAVQVLTGVIDAAAGESHSLFIKSDRTLWTVGNNTYGQLGSGGTTSRSTPQQVDTGVLAAAAGAHYSLYLKTDGTLWGMGQNINGEFGAAIGLGQRTESPVQLAADVVRFAAGGKHIAYITSDRKLWVLGDNASGQLGTGDTTMRSAPFLLSSDAILVAAGGAHTLFTDSTGAVWAVGANESGQLGLGRTANPVLLPVKLWDAQATTPSSVNSVIATDGTLPDAIQISWTPVAGASSYEVLRSSSPDSASATLLAAGLRTPLFYDRTATPGTLFYYWIRARSGLDASELSAADAGIGTAVAGLPRIGSSTSNQSSSIGSNASFYVTASSSTTLSYQWRKDGTPIPGATQSSYAIYNLTFAAAGNYDVVVTNSVGSIVSPVSKLTINRGFQTISPFGQADRIYDTTPFVAGPATSSAGRTLVYTILSGPATISGNLMTLTGVGTVNYQASQPGDSEYYPASSAVNVSFTVRPATAELSLSGLLRTYTGQPNAVTATATPAASNIAITYNGSLTPPTAAGQYTVVATVTDAYLQGSRVGLLSIMPATQGIDFNPPTKIRDDRTLVLSASATSGLPVGYSLDSGPGNLAGSTLTPDGPGSFVVRAQQPGDSNYDASPVAIRTIKAVETFSSWRKARFTTNELLDGTISSPAADPDQDSQSNLVEYALGTDPFAPDRAPVELSLNSDSGLPVWDYSYSRAPDRLDLDYIVERSENLQDWTAVDLLHEPTTTPDRWRARFFPGAATKPVFFRLRLTRQ